MESPHPFLQLTGILEGVIILHQEASDALLGTHPSLLGIKEVEAMFHLLEEPNTQADEHAIGVVVAQNSDLFLPLLTLSTKL